MKLLRKLLRFSLNLAIALVVFFVLVEVAFRYWWVDFYSAEFNALNTEQALENSTGPTVLVGGDSFTGVQHGYVQTMRTELPDARIINAGIPGTGMPEAACFLPDRIEEWQPDVFIYQIYVGNDLLDISHPVESPNIGTARKVYWWLSDRLRSVRYINYKLAQFRYQFTDEVGNAPSALNEAFSVEHYSAREKMNFAAEPALIYNSAFLKGGRRADFEVLVAELNGVLDVLPDSCRSYILVIPHCAQVTEEYQSQMAQLGAVFPQGFYQGMGDLTFGLDSAMAQRTNVQVVSAYAVLHVEELMSGPVYYTDDPHLNEQGHAALGKGLARLVLEKE